jgi:hypothetical protein
MHVVDSVEIRVHPSKLTRVLSDARERGARVATNETGWLIDGLPVILDRHVDAPDGYAVSYGAGNFWG